MSDDDFGDEDEIIVVHGRRLHSVEDATFKWYTDGEQVFPVGRSKGNFMFPDEVTLDRRISMGAGGLLMRLLANDAESIDVEDLVRESQARNDAGLRQSRGLHQMSEHCLPRESSSCPGPTRPRGVGLRCRAVGRMGRIATLTGPCAMTRTIRATSWPSWSMWAMWSATATGI